MCVYLRLGFWLRLRPFLAAAAIIIVNECLSVNRTQVWLEIRVLRNMREHDHAACKLAAAVCIAAQDNDLYCSRHTEV